jgi:hypothetical protein
MRQKYFWNSTRKREVQTTSRGTMSPAIPQGRAVSRAGAWGPDNIQRDHEPSHSTGTSSVSRGSERSRQHPEVPRAQPFHRDEQCLARERFGPWCAGRDQPLCGKATRWNTEVRFPVGDRHNSHLHTGQTDCGPHPASYPGEVWVVYPQGKAAGVKNGGNAPPRPASACSVCCLIN